MDRLTFRRVLWTLHRGQLRHGVLMWASLAAGFLVIVLSMSVIASMLRLRRIGIELAMAQTHALHGAPAEAVVTGESESLPLPSAARRFEITQLILKELQDEDFAPEQIHFKFEHAAEAGVTRQIAVFTVRTRWDKVADLLSRLQSSDRAIYIARLRVARENAGGAMVDADIQLAVSLLDDKPNLSVTP